ncbi:flagellar hook-basal body protein [Desulfosporosinus nitroreducens]|uniref:Flagellar hook-basal body protein n=1 Tax=Desulfosporosinus nitroreducens TaxID=2018668 RepID=A0ABT8QKE0_9FIRM|nr:flagellar hook-basal body protein [Desulfosporosinus nitroreducens]MCO1601283.1 flagellar hook-basal body protein [Desulfosporosinus nitroreducens]MDO0821784.1 flagellar hook-basal body protein [Desulfosporosinus nitroreducens]
MIRGLYTSATGLLAAQTQSEVIGDNVVNLKTSGYKEQTASNISFPSMLIQRMGGNEASEVVEVGEMGRGVGVDRLAMSNVQGSLEATEINTDLALTSPGYFVVQTPGGERYTRNGHFQLDGDGMLRTADGYSLQGEAGPIGPLSSEFRVSADGTIMDQGQRVDQIRVVEIPADALQREGQSLYIANQPVQAAVGAVRQGAVEASNVDLSGQMIQMMTVMKAYEANQKIIQTQDEMLGKAVNEVGKI